MQIFFALKTAFYWELEEIKINVNKLINEVIESPNSVHLKTILLDFLEEYDRLDFKEDYQHPEKIAKHILAMANSGGGLIVIGVKEDKENKIFKPVGLNNKEIDKDDFSNRIQKYIPTKLKYSINRYNENDLTFHLITIKNIPEYLPFMVVRDGEKIKSGDIFTRRGTKSIKANNFDIEEMFQKKSSALNLHKEPEEFEDSIKKLKILYKSISKFKNKPIGFFEKLAQVYSLGESEENQYYPEEGFDEFIAKLIDIQKSYIKDGLG